MRSWRRRSGRKSVFWKGLSVKMGNERRGRILE
jgi:hypothetical protein